MYQRALSLFVFKPPSLSAQSLANQDTPLATPPSGMHQNRAIFRYFSPSCRSPFVLALCLTLDLSFRSIRRPRPLHPPQVPVQSKPAKKDKKPLTAKQKLMAKMRR